MSKQFSNNLGHTLVINESSHFTMDESHNRRNDRLALTANCEELLHHVSYGNQGVHCEHLT